MSTTAGVTAITAVPQTTVLDRFQTIKRVVVSNPWRVAAVGLCAGVGIVTLAWLHQSSLASASAAEVEALRTASATQQKVLDDSTGNLKKAQDQIDDLKRQASDSAHIISAF